MGRVRRRGGDILRLSASFAPASLAAAAGRLRELKRLLADSREVVDRMALVADRLRKVAAPPGEPFIFTTKLAENERLLRQAFQDCDDVKFRNFTAGGKGWLLVYLEGMTDTERLEEQVIGPLLAADGPGRLGDARAVAGRVLTAAAVSVAGGAGAAVEEVLTGNGLLLADGSAEGLVVGAVEHVKRGVEEPKAESVARGPHDAFTETLKDNVALLRRRARDANIKVRILQIGARTQTALALVYAADIVKPGLVAEVERRIGNIRIDEIMLSAQVEEFIIDHPWSPFPQTHVTERPDTFLISIYEGRVGLIVDNTPHAIIVPCTLPSLLQSVEDFTVQPAVASLIRVSRYAAAALGTFLPALYVAIVSYNPGMLPTTLAISVAELRARTPYPAFMEVVIMEIILELFQEAVLRLPQKISPAASIVGGFVIGTTIVQAGIVNALLVVATAGTAIASYTMPSYNLGLALRWLRIPTVVAAAVLGFYGLVLAYLAIIIHMCSLRSFGESFLGGLFDVTLAEDMQDKLVRVPMPLMGSRPKVYGAQDRSRVGD
ncbi:spore germination protein [Anaeroselena agilis]|uniref:Spore germination protein n=1 Tax=Anaeroselena agilis TaxID=3063788 RepID=A0ABU3P2P0_9FIRM|nr:spore germination protein [Selenomonadales bacterium 4137-cl]